MLTAMNIKRLTGVIMLSLLAMTMSHASANEISSTSAHAIANEFIKRHSSNAPGSLRSPAAADIKLAHAEPSSKVKGTNVYYAFNINGGGFIIVAGDDRASQVLGYSDKGRIDFNHLPDPLKDQLDSYKYDIEYVQSHHVDASHLAKRPVLKDGEAQVIVEPMTTSTWGQENPYNLQLPVYDNKASRAGCIGISMSQLVYFWKYPETCGPYASYYNSKASQDVPELPATTFDFTKMRNSYCHWDWDQSVPVQDIFDEDLVQEAAKLCRYMGQSVQMQYGNSVSVATYPNSFNALLSFGYNPKARYLKKSLTSYSQEAWENLIRSDLDAGRPVIYNAYSGTSVGHSYIIDGYNNEGFFHINMGWYGTNDGWYQMTAVQLVNRFGVYYDYSNNPIMFIGMEPPTFCTLKATDVNADNGLIVLGSNLEALAHKVYLFTSHRELDLVFTLTDASGQTVATSDAQRVIRHRFEQGCDISHQLTLPTQLAPGTYDLRFGYSLPGQADSLVNVEDVPCKLVVVGKLAKLNGGFDIEDVTKVIQYVLNQGGNDLNVTLDVTDVTDLIDYILN